MYAGLSTISGTEASLGAPYRRYRRIVERIEELARSRMGEPVHIPDLCADAGIGERVLRNAFHAIHHCPPYRRLRAFRMDEARKALLNPERAATVTEIAMRFGFFELGRFSVEYRQAFGERPSETLRRAGG
jgi:transcriptional regulator GlxA family with amidase domain